MSIRKTLNYVHDHGTAGSCAYVQTRFCPFGSQTWAFYTKHPGLIITSRKICARLAPFAQFKKKKKKKTKRSRDLLHIPECIRRSQDDSPQPPCPLQVVLRTNHSAHYKSYAGGRYVVLLGRKSQVLLTSETLQHFYEDGLTSTQVWCISVCFRPPKNHVLGLTTLFAPASSCEFYEPWCREQVETRSTFQASGPSLAALTPSPGNQQDVLMKDRHQLLQDFFFGHHLLWNFFFICKIAELVPLRISQKVSAPQEPLSGADSQGHGSRQVPAGRCPLL